MLKSLIGLIKVVENWPEVLLSRYFRLPIKEIRLRNGIKFSATSIDHAEISMLVDIWHKQVYTPPFFSIDSQDIIIDVGANKGYFSVFAATQARNGKVYAFEPVTELAACALENSKLNRLNNLTIINKALWNESGEKPFYLSTNSGGHSMRAKPSSYAEITVPTIRLDEFCKAKQINIIDLLKLDCEGAEYDILMTLDKEFLDQIKKISMEIHDFGGYHHNQILDFLEKNNFKTKELKGYVYAWRD